MSEVLSDKVYEYLLNSIINQELAQGEVISEVVTGKTLNVSRSPIREAIQRLENDGLIITYPNRGHFVKVFTIQDVDEIFDLREMLECYALRKSFVHIDIRRLDELEKEIRTAMELDIEEAYFKSNTDLHETLVAYSGNTRLRMSYDRLSAQTRVVNRISARDPSHFKNSSKSHLEIVLAMKKGNCEEAEKLLINHLEDARMSTKKSFSINRCLKSEK